MYYTVCSLVHTMNVLHNSDTSFTDLNPFTIHKVLIKTDLFTDPGPSGDHTAHTKRSRRSTQSLGLVPALPIHSCYTAHTCNISAT